MKFVNKVCLLTGLVFTLTLAGCAPGVKKEDASLTSDRDRPVQLMETARYIPKRVVDEETGALVPYQPVANPYAALKGRISGKYVKQFVLARNAFQLGDLVGAKKLLEPLISQDSGLSGPWVMLGDIALQQQKLDEAVEHYARAIEINEVNVNAYIRMAKVQRMKGAFLPAQNTYAKALSKWPDYPQAHINLAILYDLYLNMPLKAQRHIEAYQFLTGGKHQEQSEWLAEIQQRTGVEIALPVEVTQAVSISSNQL